MTKKKTISIIAVVVLIIASLTLSACDFGKWFKPDLDAPTLTINSVQKTISWQNVTNADNYEIYLNDNKIDTVVGVSGTNTYNFNEKITDNISVYKFYLIATADGYNSSGKSNVVTYLANSNNTEVSNISYVNNKNLEIVKNLSVNNGVLTWDAVTDATEYYVFMYTNSLGEQLFKTTVTGFNFSEYVSDDEVVLFRVGIKNGDDEYVMSNTLYYNTNSVEPTYNNKFYYFHGNVNDYYITSQEELNDIVYYAFIYKLDALPLCISQDYLNSLVSKYGTANGWNHLINAINVATSSYTESCHYDTRLSDVTSSNYYKRTFTIDFVYAGDETPVNTLEKLRTQNELDTPYYEKVDYEKRAADYDNFVSDKKLFVEYVESSEELYHVVESGATPLFASTDSAAYRIYNEAKQVLREIISDEMTDYEKILSIFDYISYNTVYDDEIVAMPEDSEPSFITYTSFFLEGVFDDGLCVCDGFSKAFSLLCNMEGIDAVRITGSVSGGLHAWNKVKLDGNWYVVDITWTVTETGENSFDASGGEAVNFNSKEFLSYKYFLVSDSFIARTHSAANKTLNNSLPATSDYYYYQNATYDGVNNFIISSDEEYEDLINYMLETKQYTIEIAFADSYITSPSYSSGVLHNRDLDEASATVKEACGITDANILYVTDLYHGYKQVSASQWGTIYSVSIINLNDALENVA